MSTASQLTPIPAAYFRSLLLYSSSTVQFLFIRVLVERLCLSGRVGHLSFLKVEGLIPGPVVHMPKCLFKALNPEPSIKHFFLSLVHQKDKLQLCAPSCLLNKQTARGFFLRVKNFNTHNIKMASSNTRSWKSIFVFSVFQMCVHSCKSEVLCLSLKQMCWFVWSWVSLVFFSKWDQNNLHFLFQMNCWSCRYQINLSMCATIEYLELSGLLSYLQRNIYCFLLIVKFLECLDP